MVNRKHSVVVPGGRGGCIAVLALGIFTFCGSEADAAEIVHVPGYSVFNHVAVPAGVPSSWGDLMFSSDGNTAYFIGRAENIGGGVWTSSVNRDVDGN